MVYFQRGCMWKGPVSDGRILDCRLYPPLLGRLTLADPREETRLDDILVWEVPAGSRVTPTAYPTRWSSYGTGWH